MFTCKIENIVAIKLSRLKLPERVYNRLVYLQVNLLASYKQFLYTKISIAENDDYPYKSSSLEY